MLLVITLDGMLHIVIALYPQAMSGSPKYLPVAINPWWRKILKESRAIKQGKRPRPHVSLVAHHTTTYLRFP